MRTLTTEFAGTLRARWPAVIAVLVPAAVSFGILIHGYDGITFLRGDCPYYYWTALALLRDHTFNLTNQLPGGWRGHLGQVAMSVGGQPVPKHPVVLSIVSLPWVATLGEAGALVFNVLQIITLVWLLFLISARVCRPAAASAAVIFTFTGSFLPHYVWNFSPDVCATLLLTGAFLLLSIDRGDLSHVFAGFLLGLACVAKFPLSLFVPGCLLLLSKPRVRNGLLVVSGASVPLALFAFFNARLFGSPFVTSYDRIVTLTANGMPAVYSQRSSFDLAVGKGVVGQLLDPRHGLLTTSAITIASLAGLPFLARKDWRLTACIVVGSLGLFLFYSTYDQWAASHYGNRFLMPVVSLFSVPLAAALERLVGTHHDAATIASPASEAH